MATSLGTALVAPRFFVALALILLINIAEARNYTSTECPVVANTESGIYHTPGSLHYRMMLKQNKNKKRDNRKCFRTKTDAKVAGYRKSRASAKGRRWQR